MNKKQFTSLVFIPELTKFHYSIEPINLIMKCNKNKLSANMKKIK